MPIQQNILAINPSTIVKTDSRSTQLNFDQQSQNDRTNFNWCVRMSQRVNNHNIVNNTFTQIGLDTLDFNSYRCFSSPTYSLSFESISIGGHTFAFSGVNVPQYGFYDTKFSGLLGTSIAGAAIEISSALLVNGSFVSAQESSQVPNVGDGAISQPVSDILECNPNDQITFWMRQINSNSATEPTVASGVFFYASVRYLGQA